MALIGSRWEILDTSSVLVVDGLPYLCSAFGNNILFGAKLAAKCQQKVQLKHSNTGKKKGEAEQ